MITYIWNKKLYLFLVIVFIPNIIYSQYQFSILIERWKTYIRNKINR